jgi:hypothetical protein
MRFLCKHRVVRVLALGIASGITASFLSACVVVSYLQYSKATASEGDYMGSVIKPDDNVELYVVPINYKLPIAFIGPLLPIIPIWSLEPLKAPFEIGITVKVKNDQSYKLRPDNFGLSIVGGTTLSPIGFIGPAKCPIPGNDKTNKINRPSDTIEIQGEMCFILRFDVQPPQVGEPFTISVKVPNRESVIAIDFLEKVGKWRVGLLQNITIGPSKTRPAESVGTRP